MFSRQRELMEENSVKEEERRVALEAKERDFSQALVKQQERVLEMCRKKMGHLAELDPESARRRAREGVQNIDLQFQVSQLEHKLDELLDDENPEGEFWVVGGGGFSGWWKTLYGVFHLIHILGNP